ncbi:hypothetical protein K438DRAFT_1838355 [Mycena galopus ATCC 62051]|nr:hypothetical protein K438DRAFT_1847315 [Mycena galopus ATCC 62051]KAF8184127.1 hypothetical protein K438DRAFT_1838355 [Mycena galopus ATCC 62051]
MLASSKLQATPSLSMFLAVSPSVTFSTPGNSCNDGQCLFICCWPPDSMVFVFTGSSFAPELR